jgi:predicted RNase H-like HicB family nuclease
VLERAFEQAILRALEQTVEAKTEELFARMLSAGSPLSKKLEEKIEQGSSASSKRASAGKRRNPDSRNELWNGGERLNDEGARSPQALAFRWLAFGSPKGKPSSFSTRSESWDGNCARQTQRGSSSQDVGVDLKTSTNGKGVTGMRYIVMIRRTSTGYSADIPDLPGCVATGMTVEHTRQQIAEALEGHLEVMRDSGETVPSPSTRLEFAVDDDTDEEFCTWVDVEEIEPAAPRRATIATKPSKRKQR